ncbi:MAG: glycosyltransferase family 2 protein [Corynebacterium sp.]|uniref:glycosyltransferase family 2 protein n=1 Tax=Corynebacterium sp. TaxID=1720 RepID=UPI0026DAFED6|nr:glycosyltransferase family 2 protein [Corynebacterium sp.]MDO4761904.1 glycosyltransferase family 2 protein [Corynebacterium sp.]
MNPTYNIIICTHNPNRQHTLHTCITALTNELHPTDTLTIIVDHNPQLEHHLKNTYPNTHIHPNTHPHGLAGARNTGITHNTKDIIVFIDDDATPQPGWRAGLTEAFADPTVTAVAGIVEPDYRGAQPKNFPATMRWIFGCDYEGMPAPGMPVRNPIGAAMAVRKEAFAHHSFSTDYGRIGAVAGAAEETEFFVRLAHHNPQTLIRRSTGFVVKHQVEPERLQLQYCFRRAYAEGCAKALLKAQYPHALGAEQRHLRVVWQALRKNPRTAPVVVTVMVGLGLGLVRGSTAVGFRRLVTTARQILGGGRRS